MPEVRRVLLTGATGFVGKHLYPVLINSGFAVVSGSRTPELAQQKFRGRAFVRIDLNDYHSVLEAMRGCDAAVYLVHSMADSPRYEETEYRAALTFARAAEQAGLKRIVYLGGVQPRGPVVSRHLRSRMRTGEALRQGRLSTIELQAAMVIGAGSESWRIVRDLAARLPVMLLPRWLESRSQPIYIDDVTAAIAHALTLELPGSGVFALPGPETLSAHEILERTAQLMGLSPPMYQVPVITPRLSSFWISLVTRAHAKIARQLVEGLRTDLIAPDEGYFRFMPHHQRVPFEEGARRALFAEAQALPWRVRLTEWLLHRLTPPHQERLEKQTSGGAAL